MLTLANLPNVVTTLRIVLIPCFVIAFYLPLRQSGVITASIFCLAAFTDWLDGFLARRLKQTSRFGAFFDPVADKLIVAVALVLLVGAYGTVWVSIPAAVIVSREITISALREWMAEIGQRAYVAVNLLGKGKTIIQFIAIILLLVEPVDWRLMGVKIGILLLYLGAFLTLWSMVVYLRAAWAALKA